MRTISAAYQAILDGVARTERITVEVKDSGGTWRDLTTYGGQDFVLAASWREDVDSNGLTADITLKRTIEEKNSLAPLVQNSPFNRALTYPGSYAPLLQVGRQVRINWGLAPEGEAPAAYVRALEGYVDRISWGDEEISLECRDDIALLMDGFIEEERIYSFAQGVNATKGVSVFKVSTAYVVGDLVVPTDLKGNGHFYKCTTAGTTAATEPTWNTGGGSTTTSGTATFTEQGATDRDAGTDLETLLQQLINDGVRTSPPTLYTPSSPGWALKWWQQSREPTLDACTNLVKQIGWDFRRKWDNGTSAFRLTLYEPDRAKLTPDRSFSPDQVLEVKKCELDIAGIRTRVDVWYSDSGDLDATGRPKRHKASSVNSSAESIYGRRWMEVQESDTSNIDTAAEATTLADAIVSDLSEPQAELEVELYFDPFVELGDLYTFEADGIRFDVDMDLAVVGYEHSVDDKGGTTSLTLRGKPSGGHAKWLKEAIEVGKKIRDSHVSQYAATGGLPTITASHAVGGTQITVVPEALGKFVDDTSLEVHLSTSSGFTPDSTTLKANTTAGVATVPDLIPGKTYYGTVIPYRFNDKRIVRGSPSNEFSFVAGQAKALHYDSLVSQGLFPLNGNFEHATDDIASFPPDHWKLGASQTWGSGGSVFHGSDSSYGRYITLREHASLRGELISSPFPVRRGLAGWNLYISHKRRIGSGASGYDLLLDIKGYSDSALATLVSNWTINILGTATTPYAVDTWYTTKWPFQGTFGAGVNFLTIGLRRQTTGSTSVAYDIGDVYFSQAEEHTMTVGTLYASAINLEAESNFSGYSNNWANYGSPYANGGYRKDPSGRVSLRGVLLRSSGTPTLGETINTLPSGYRPLNDKIFTVMTNTGAARLDITSAGVVTYISGGHAALSLDGVSFYVD